MEKAKNEALQKLLGFIIHELTLTKDELRDGETSFPYGVSITKVMMMLSITGINEIKNEIVDLTELQEAMLKEIPDARLQDYFRERLQGGLK